MYDDLDTFVSNVNNFLALQPNDQVDWLAYYLVSQKGVGSFTAGDIHTCFEFLNLGNHVGISMYLSRQAKKRDGKYYKQKKTRGYQLKRQTQESLKSELGIVEQQPQLPKDLSNLSGRIGKATEKAFLEEAVRCYGSKSYRATIILVWILTMDHLQQFVFADKKLLKDFNSSLLSENWNRKKIQIVKYDDFSELKEKSKIDLLRKALIINQDVKKILDQKLGTRDSAAHPSSVKFTPHKVIDYVTDLVDNVILHY